MKKTKIVGILIKDRIKEAGKVQDLLSRHQRIIYSRLGFHELNDAVCSRVGIILVTLTGDPEQWKAFEDDLARIEGLEVQEMLFVH